MYALAGRIDVDLCREPLGVDAAGRPVRMEELMPSAGEIAAAMAVASDPSMFADDGGAPGAAFWDALEAPSGPRFPWDARSTHLIEPPFFAAAAESAGLPAQVAGARASRSSATRSPPTTSRRPARSRPTRPPGATCNRSASRPRDFGSYVGRRGNHHVMARGTFASIRLRNAMVPGVEGGHTLHQPGGDAMTIFEAAERYRAAGVPSIVLGGKDYGSGSSRDWAAKGTALLGVAAVIAESFERIHRANLVGMGVVPLQFAPGEGWRTLGLTGEETFDLPSMRAGIKAGAAFQVVATRPSGERVSFDVTPQVLTAAERRMMLDGGMMRDVLAQALEVLRARLAAAAP